MRIIKTALLFYLAISLGLPALAVDRYLLDCGLEKGYQPSLEEIVKGGTNPWLDDITWLPLPLATGAFRRSASGIIGDYLYIFGGMGGAGSSTAMALNIATETWAASTLPTITGFNWNAVVADDELYLFPKLSAAEVQKFVPTGGGPTGSWSLYAIYPEVNYAFAIAWDGGDYIYCAGKSASPYGTTAYRLEIATATFTPIAPLPEGKGWVGGAWIDGYFYVVGGVSSTYVPSTTGYKYNPTTNTWTQIANLLEPGAFSCWTTTTDGEKLYVVGGGGSYTGNPGIDAVQVYDPATNTWVYETDRMTDYGCNTGMYVEDGNYLFDGGGWDGVVGQALCWKGLLEEEVPDLDLTMEPVSPPIIIPPGGGTFQYTATIENTTGEAITFDYWVMVELPSGTLYGPAFLRSNLTLAAGASISRTLTQNVPAGAPAGNYDYIGYVGDYDTQTIIDQDNFEFTKSGFDAAGGTADIGEW